MVTYLEETFSFIGDPENSAQEKDIIFKESYSKIFRDDEVQIEDDLDDNRSTNINKDVQAYLKDIDFFFKDATFTLKVEDIKPQTNDKGETFFKVTMMRTIVGHNIVGDSINSTIKRYMEVNVDRSKKEMKIASMYTTKPNETEELRVWWNRMPAVWKMYFGENRYILDSIEMADIIHIYRDSIVIVNDSLMESTIACNMPVLYEKLTDITKITDVDVSHNNNITTLDPLIELSELQNLDCSSTNVEDISPIRNLNKINSLDISSTQITDISDLRYANNIKVLRANNIRLDNIDIIGLYGQLTNLSLTNTDVSDISMLENCEQLLDLDIAGTKVMSLDSIVLPQSIRFLNLSNTEIDDITTLENLENLQVLIIDNTYITDLSPLANLNKLNELQCRNTGVSDIMPLKDLQHLARIYCDNTQIDSDKAENFRRENNRVIVIYETKALQDWWNRLHISWKRAFAEQNNTELDPSPEELHNIISMKSLTIDQHFVDALPVERLTDLEVLNLENSKIADLTPLHTLHNLRYLNIKNTKVTDLTPLEDLVSLQEINMENTNVSKLEPLCGLSNLMKINAENTKVKSEQVLKLRLAQPSVTVIYQTDELRSWWNTLDNNWREVFRNTVEIDTNPKAEQLQAVANIEELTVDSRIIITSLEPLTKLLFLKKLIINDNHITDLSPLSELTQLKELNINGNAISDLNVLNNFKSLEVLSIENTNVIDINALEDMKDLRVLNISNTKIKNIKVLSTCTSLEELNIANSNVKSLSPVSKIETLRYIKAFNTKIKTKEIDALRNKRPEINIVYH
jgi:Leucine-rich repeat (LRR) protein